MSALVSLSGALSWNFQLLTLKQKRLVTRNMASNGVEPFQEPTDYFFSIMVVWLNIAIGLLHLMHCGWDKIRVLLGW